jgi:toxin ParE1/3/4
LRSQGKPIATLTESTVSLRLTHPSAASTWLNGLHEALASLSESPQRCPVIREDLALRHLLYGNKPHIYRAIFRIREESAEVLIVTIRHGARDAYKP